MMSTIDDLIREAAQRGATIIINSLHTGDVYQAHNMQIGDGNQLDASQSLHLPEQRSRPILDGVDYRYSHCAPLDPSLHTHAEAPFEPDYLCRREKGDVYNG